MKIAKQLSIPVEEYANTGNSILGIKGKGKSFTAMKIAEELMMAGVPIVALDPVGIWRFLRVGNDGKSKGFPVVVAGGEDPDLKLTKENAKQIMQAAMKENVSIVFDLFEKDLAVKATWISIVRDVIHTLMYENKAYNVRHVFIEEAAEFIPQRLGPQHSQVYAEIERLARMGRNAKLGYTLINQRAEEVNKAILEICDRSFIHAQVGKNSLLSIKKWMDAIGVAAPELNDLPRLQKGECFMIEAGSAKRLNILPKKTFHPSPEKHETQIKFTDKADVSQFIENMNKELAPKEKVKPIVHVPTNKEQVRNNLTGEHLKSVQNLGKQIERERAQAKKAFDKFNADYAKEYEKANKELNRIRSNFEQAIAIFQQNATAIGNLFSNLLNKPMEFSPVEFKPVVISGKGFPTSSSPVSQFLKQEGRKLGAIVDRSVMDMMKYNKVSGMFRILKCATKNDCMTRKYIAILAGLQGSSGSFRNNISQLKASGYITTEGDTICITDAGRVEAQKIAYEIPSPEQRVAMWKDIVGGAAATLLQHMADISPSEISRHDLGAATGLSYESGSFRNNISTLHRNGLIVKTGSELTAADELFK